MTEIEVPIEGAQEKIHETAEHANEKWIGQVALYSALVAAMAAVCALLAGHHADEAMITQIRASDQWGYYQAQGIKAAVLQTKTQLLAEFGKGAVTEDREKSEQYKDDQESISEKAKELEHESEHHLAIHGWLARGVTFFQVAIAVAAISVLAKRRRYWLVSSGFSLIGIIFFLLGLRG